MNLGNEAEEKHGPEAAEANPESLGECAEPSVTCPGKPEACLGGDFS